ncbi:MAG: glutamine--tRNA ligase/YqeY domain fusion protein [Myxococcota bacterium]|nr:glutamine--tRNA ligase/YqeY domain fusion protein [Myxococcota bacterium]
MSEVNAGGVVAESESESESEGSEKAPSNFLRQIVESDLSSGKHSGRVVTRFPPEPNGYLHIGHAKSICLNFGLARDYHGICHLRMDDTNPLAEDSEYVDSIQRDVKWLGFDWGEKLFYASDYFEKLYGFAVTLIKKGKAYVCSLSEEDIRIYRGTVKEAGKPSPYRSRSVEENLQLFEEMREGKYADGEHVLRANIDMNAANMKMRDPLLYRIRHAHHHRSGDAWCIYPMYDFAHCLSDSIEGITHSICTLEFENNRDIYDWLVHEAEVDCEPPPQQFEFARLNLSYTVMSKRKLRALVENGDVAGWDDPRMPTIAGMRRRGYTSAAIQDFCERVGVAKANSLVDMAQLEFSVRNDLNQLAPRRMCVLEPLKITLDNYPAEKVEWLEGPSFPHDVPKEGSRKLPFGKTLYIDRNDFMEDAPKKFFRLAPQKEVRLRYGYVIKCEEVIKDEEGNIVELKCSYDVDTLGKKPEGRKVKGVIHWVSAEHGLPVEVRLYDRLFDVEQPDVAMEAKSFTDFLNTDSLQVVKAFIEPSVADDDAESCYQFERVGYFVSDSVDSKPGALVFNRTVALKDSWGKKHP